MPEIFIETERILLRSWKEEDADVFFQLNSDSDVMQYFPSSSMTKESTENFVKKNNSHFKTHGFGYFACEHKKNETFIGFVGLSTATFKADFTPCTEIGWRLNKHYWNCGLASEAAKSVLKYAKETVGIEKTYSFTACENMASRRVMEKIGLHYIKDFDHSSLPVGHRLRRHVLYST